MCLTPFLFVWFCVCFSVRAPGKYHTTIYPYIHQTCNNRKSEDQLRSVVIPDVDPTDVPPTLNFSMAAGDFLEVYAEEGTVSLSAKWHITVAPHEVARSITTSGWGGRGEKGVQAHSRFPLQPLSRHTLLMSERGSF